LMKRNQLTAKAKKTPKNNTPADTKDTLLSIGRILRPHGLHGEVKAELLSTVANRFRTLEEVILELRTGERIACTIEYVRECGDILKFLKIDDRNAAEKLKGAYITVTRDNAAPLDSDSYYIFDLVGLEVFTADNEKIGRVRRVEEYPAHDVIVVEKNDEILMVPAVREYIQEVDLSGKRMTITVPEGLPGGPKGVD